MIDNAQHAILSFAIFQKFFLQNQWDNTSLRTQICYNLSDINRAKPTKIKFYQKIGLYFCFVL